ncbi:tRNA lysidine(34) synthetase TilS [Bernardetia sp. ABR2-2B]|uniref:tRNA lysidine(34) synthetase TilS n=1 Tax=Bernardetia sp. ABR2-2B TaxID=3127472 RepID=UPI0030D59F57
MTNLKIIDSFCTENDFDLGNKSILVAASGGVDSMVLIDTLLKINSNLHKKITKIGIAHCNFSLRDEESEQDEIFIKEYAVKNNIPFYSIKFNTKQIAKTQQKSIQLVARELRYDFFEKISQEKQYDFVATAHHLSDSLETSIYHLSKGTGIAGVRGILPKRNSRNSSESDSLATQIIRPLLCITKEEIISYANENNLKWREDASNQTQKYKRNFIRHQIIPRLKEINRDTEKTFLNTSERLRSMENLLQTHVNDFENFFFKKENGSSTINSSQIKKLREPLLIVSEFLKKRGFSYKQAKQIIKQLDTLEQEKTKRFVSKSHILYTNKKEWILAAQEENQLNQLSNETEEFLISLNDIKSDNFVFQSELQGVTLTFEECSPKEVDFKSKAMYLDADKLEFPLILRKWKDGDKFVPLGMKNQKSIGDFLTDLKISMYERNFVYVLLSKNKISWVGVIQQNEVKGLRISNPFKLNEHSKNIIVIK